MALKKFFEEHHLAPRFLTRLLKNDSKYYNCLQNRINKSKGDFSI